MRVRKLTTALAAVPLLLAGSISAATADDISNQLDATVDATAEVMPLNVGGANGTTQLYVAPTNGDGKNGCNLTGSATLTVALQSSNTTVATVSPSSVTFTACGDTPTVTVTPIGLGSATISAFQTANTTEGSFNLAPATFRVDVAAPSNTAPAISVAGVAGGASYAKGSVPEATCRVTDAEDGPDSFPAELSAVTGTYASDGIGAQTASCSYTDGGGLTAVASETYDIVDPTAPAITYALSPLTADGDEGWYRSAVTLDWTVTEPESPSSLQRTGCADQSIAQDQAETTYTCSATSAGGSATEQRITIKRDATAPTNISFTAGPADDGRYYPNNVPGSPECTAQDDLSGLKSCVVTGLSSAVGEHTLTATATDVAGNTSTATRKYTVRKLDVMGFYAPVDMAGVFNTVKGGSTVPLKFEVFDGTTELTSTGAIGAGFTAKAITCPSGNVTTDEIEVLSSGATSLRYDTTGGQFIQNWQTPKKPGACYAVTVTTIDGSTQTANFQLK